MTRRLDNKKRTGYIYAMKTPSWILCGAILLLSSSCNSATDSQLEVPEQADGGNSDVMPGDAMPTSSPDAKPSNLCTDFASIDEGVHTRNITVAGKEREYTLSIPANYDPSKQARLVFGWHGMGGDGPWLRLYTNVERESRNDSGTASVFVYPNGLLLESFGRTGWENSDAQLFDAIVAELTSELCIDEERIFSYGHSFGGYFSNALGCLRGDVLRAIAPVSGGWAVGASSCQSALPVWLAHATDDPRVEVTQGRAARDQWLSRNQCEDTNEQVSPSPCVKYGNCANDASVVWCEPASGGHGWPGYANKAIWEFFQSFDAI